MADLQPPTMWKFETYPTDALSCNFGLEDWQIIPSINEYRLFNNMIFKCIHASL